MQPTATFDPAVIQRSVDQRVILQGVDWPVYETLLAARGEKATPGKTCLEGALELTTPTRDHEILKRKLARPVEAYAEELDIELEGYGSWTLERMERDSEPLKQIDVELVRSLLELRSQTAAVRELRARLRSRTW
jgi:hypothetical protein